MSDLARRLIAEAQADCASRLGAIEAHAGRIEEAEALAATLRSHGIAEAQAQGMTFAAWLDRPARTDTWVTLATTGGEELDIALRDAGLRIAAISGELAGYSWKVLLEGLETPLHVSTPAGISLQTRRLNAAVALAPEPAHG